MELLFLLLALMGPQAIRAAPAADLIDAIPGWEHPLPSR